MQRGMSYDEMEGGFGRPRPRPDGSWDEGYQNIFLYFSIQTFFLILFHSDIFLIAFCSEFCKDILLMLLVRMQIGITRPCI